MKQLEHVPLDTERDPRDMDQSDILSILRDLPDTRSEQVSILKGEQIRIKKLKSEKPHTHTHMV